MKNILDRVGLGDSWNEGKRIEDMVGTVSRLVASRLESKEVQVWQAEKATSPSLGILHKKNYFFLTESKERH